MGKLRITREVDGVRMTYVEEFPRRRMVDLMRAEELKPGKVVAVELVEEEKP